VSALLLKAVHSLVGNLADSVDANDNSENRAASSSSEAATGKRKRDIIEPLGKLPPSHASASASATATVSTGEGAGAGAGAGAGVAKRKPAGRGGRFGGVSLNPNAPSRR
jgi:hypothetical protein